MSETSQLMRKLHELAQNLWWSWRPEIRSIFRELDPEAWTAVYHNPVAMLHRLDDASVARRVSSLEMQTRIDQAHRRLGEYLRGGDGWGAIHASALLARPVAYFSAEFGLHQSIPVYSGGLGVLAGDHLKSMSDLGVPVVGIGLLYHQGYVHQLIDAAGDQRDHYEPVDSGLLPISPVQGPDAQPVRVAVELPGRTVQLRIWRVAVGRCTLLLLDARDDENSEEDRSLTDRLYGGDTETRIQQEVLLGVGGCRALAAIGIHPSVLHLNEGHSAFALLEWAHQIAAFQGLSARAALREVAAMSVFTTHTPVEAGHDRFDPSLAAHFLAPLFPALGLSPEELVLLGLEKPGEADSLFCPTALALQLTRRANGVSALHGRVSRKMWHHLYPSKSEEEVPIGHITNGVHVRTWIATDMHELLVRHVSAEWTERMADRDLWQRIEEVPDAELWEVHQVLKGRMVDFVRGRLADRRHRENLQEPAQPLHAEALTLGFARRFATYKRADLLLADPDRLARLVGDPARPLQIVFAGKAHPRDEAGKELVRKVSQLENDPRFAGRIVLVENYSMHVARQLVQGVDVWVNTPRRPNEACGTSGQKCILNGVLNLSILDGWWAEGYDGANGFAIGHGESHSDPEIQDARDAESLYQVLEQQVIPLYYERNGEDLPHAWIQRVKRAIHTMAWRFNADRMVRDYVEECYLPAAGGGTCRMPPR
ncbi:MAG TPA: alpha-glucan family phosphorylase [Thermoanaerobaculia bacterium]|jgi:starch phosphorylase|nr:alpha-glucan family phosphorylase [Thermoanaerobaculia bacterium]